MDDGSWDQQAVNVFEQTLDGVLVMSTDGAIEAANPAACRILGWSQAELKTLGRAGVADRGDPRWAGALAAHAHDGSFRGPLRVRRPDGSTPEVDVTTGVLPRPDGSAWAYVRESAIPPTSGRSSPAPRRWSTSSRP